MVIDGSVNDELWLVHGPLPLCADRFDEGLDVRHCALSLVGEPIMYPEINKLADHLFMAKLRAADVL